MYFLKAVKTFVSQERLYLIGNTKAYEIYSFMMIVFSNYFLATELISNLFR